MTQITELWTNRADLRNTKIVTRTAPELAEGEILMKIEKFGLTANNVSYAITGDSIGYWGYFPADETWGKVPAWGFGRLHRTKPTANECVDRTLHPIGDSNRNREGAEKLCNPDPTQPVVKRHKTRRLVLHQKR